MDRVFEKFRGLMPTLPNQVLYAFEGKHEAYPSRAVLYIGKTEAGKGIRPCDSAYARLYCSPEMASCYGDMTLRWSAPPDNPGPPDNKVWDIQDGQTPTQVLERLLIHAMKPVLNSQGVDAWLPSDPWFRKLIVCNKGDKGLLRSVVYGDYFARETPM
jgi:hypothetical protein